MQLIDYKSYNVSSKMMLYFSDLHQTFRFADLMNIFNNHSIKAEYRLKCEEG